MTSAHTSPSPRSDEPDNRINVGPEEVPIRRKRQRIVIDWGALRHDYETTTISIRALSRFYGLPSDTPIHRKIKANGWTREVESITANLVQAGVALSCPQKSPLSNASAQCTQPTDAVAHEQGAHRDDGDVRTALHTTAHSHARPTITGEAPRPSRFAASGVCATRPVLPGAASYSKTDCRADRHAVAVQQQLDSAERMSAMGLRILAIIHSVLIAPSGAMELGEARARLKLINPEKETLSRLAKAAMALLEGAAVIQRRALAMDVAKGPGADDPLTAAPCRDANEVMQRLPPELCTRLRDVSLELSRLRPPIDETVRQ